MIILAVEVESRTYAKLPLMSFMSYLISDLDLALLGLCKSGSEFCWRQFHWGNCQPSLRIPNLLSSLLSKMYLNWDFDYENQLQLAFCTVFISPLCRAGVWEWSGSVGVGFSSRWISRKTKGKQTPGKKFNSVATRPHICSCHLPTLVRVLSALTSCFSGWSFMVSTNFSDNNTIFSSLPVILSNQYFK